MQSRRSSLPARWDSALDAITEWGRLDELLTSERFAGLENVIVEVSSTGVRAEDILLAFQQRLPETHAGEKLIVSCSL